MTTDSIGNVYVTGQSLGTGGYGDIVTIKYGVTGINEWDGHPAYDAPFNLRVSPNPFNHFTDIRYQMTDSRQECGLAIYDISGRLITDLSDQISVIGHQLSVRWDGTDQLNRPLPGGVYFLRLKSGDRQLTHHLLLVR
jgi:hypothetical protein